MGKDVAVQESKKMATIVESGATQFKSLLPNHINKDRFLKSAILALNANPDLKECTQKSIISTLCQAAEIGLDFTPAKGHAYIVKFANEAKFMPGYRGLMELVRRTGKVKKIESHIVYENDKFEISYGTESYMKHAPIITGARGAMIGAYAIAILETGENVYEFMNMDDLNKVRATSRMARKGAWAAFETEMYRKIPIRRLFKYLPSSPDLDTALSNDNDSSGFEFETPVQSPDLAEPKAPKPESKSKSKAVENVNVKEEKKDKTEPPLQTEENPKVGFRARNSGPAAESKPATAKEAPATELKPATAPNENKLDLF